MKVLITGIEGYIGTRLAEVLMDSGFDVVGLDSGFYRDGHLYDGVKIPENIIKKDVRNISKEDLEGIEGIVHLAELSNDPLGENNPELTYEINNKGTERLAGLAKKAGVGRFVYSSSCSVYGASDELSNENSPTNPLTAYAKCKILNERFLADLADGNFTPVILRNATVFGLSPRMRFDLAVNNLTGLAWTEGKIKMESDGTPWRPFVHILDVCEAMKRALLAPREIVHKEIFNVGSTTSNYQIKDIARIISEAFPNSDITLNLNAVDKRNYRVNFDKINSVLPGFSAARTVKEGVDELFEIYRKIGMTRDIFESRLYTRLKQIKYLSETGKIDEHFFVREYAV